MTDAWNRVGTGGRHHHPRRRRAGVDAGRQGDIIRAGGALRVRRFRYRGETTAPKRHVAVSGGGAENLKGFELEDLEARIEQLENRDTKEIRPNSNLRLAA